jgi:hypothetical protein
VRKHIEKSHHKPAKQQISVNSIVWYGIMTEWTAKSNRVKNITTAVQQKKKKRK